jgi:hypothetical protein
MSGRLNKQGTAGRRQQILVRFVEMFVSMFKTNPRGRMNNSSHFQTGPTLERARFKRSDEAAVPSRVDHRAHDPCGPQLIVYSRDSPYRFQQFPEAPFATRVDVRLLALEPQPEHSDLARRAMQRLPLLNVVHGM